MASNRFIPLTQGNIKDIVCCPGGTDIADKEMKGDIYKTVSWRKEMMDKGMEGIVHYRDGIPAGFVEYMPSETAPMPIIAPGACTLMCFHWKVLSDNGHLEEEFFMLEKTIEKVEDRFTGMAVLAYDHPSHFPISMMERLGFNTVETQDYLHLMWKPFKEVKDKPRFTKEVYFPETPASEDQVIIEQGYSHRCAYSIHNANRIQDMINNDIDSEKITHLLHTVDTRKDALKYSVSPWNWDWLYINGARFEMINVNTEQLKNDILERL
ncbi:MAG: hypothetical protein R6U17_08825 [Thermoplasmata archaeon]